MFGFLRHNWKKYQKRRSIRNEWKRRLEIERKSGTQFGYAHAVEEYRIVTAKIRRYYDRTGRMC